MCKESRAKTPSDQFLLATPIPWDPLSSLQIQRCGAAGRPGRRAGPQTGSRLGFRVFTTAAAAAATNNNKKKKKKKNITTTNNNNHHHHHTNNDNY